MQLTRLVVLTARRAVVSISTAALLLLLLGLSTQCVQANTEMTLHDFIDPTVLNDGSQPYGALVFDPPSGNLYGTTRFGGKYGKGTLYCFNPNHIIKILHSFSGPDGANPTCALIDVPSPISPTAPSTLYGTTLRGGRNSAGPLNMGTVFKITTAGTGFAVLHSFFGAPNDGAYPYAGVIRASDGKLYGTTLRGGAFNMGTTYSLKVTGGPTTITHSFSGLTAGVPPDGASPYARLLEFRPGALVGTTASGGRAGLGVAFTEALSGVGYALIHTFLGTPDGANPTAELIMVTDTSGLVLLYGTTVNGGAVGGGTAYRMDVGGGSYSVIYDFGSPGDAANPWAGLFYYPTTGLIYGTSRNGGTAGAGTVFDLTPASPSTETVIHSFAPLGPVDDGANPVSAVILYSDGLLYGTCTDQGANFDGTIYNITP